MNTTQNIIIIGYPKSGTTWLSRLVADILNCPLKGDWGFDDINSLYAEGEQRKSNYRVYKTHQTASQLFDQSNAAISKTVYVIRDPRDIVISGMHYFDFNALKKARLKRIGLGKFQAFFIQDISAKEKKMQMIKAVLEGNKRLNQWLSRSWKEHFEGYEKTDTLFVKYESLLEEPETICAEIIAYLGYETSSERIKNSIKNQEFEQKKKALKKVNHPTQNLMRIGKSGYWKTELTPAEVARFKSQLGTDDKFYNF